MNRRLTFRKPVAAEPLPRPLRYVHRLQKLDLEKAELESSGIDPESLTYASIQLGIACEACVCQFKWQLWGDWIWVRDRWRALWNRL